MPGGEQGTTMDISGHWCGEYVYDKDPRERQKPALFTVDLQQSLLWWFSGTVNDDPSEGMPETGTIAGKCFGPYLSFVKRMPVCYVTHNGISVPLASLVASEYQDRLRKPTPHCPIYYAGKWQPERNAFVGTWRFKPGIIWLASGRYLTMPASYGTWTMTRCPATER